MLSRYKAWGSRVAYGAILGLALVWGGCAFFSGKTKITYKTDAVDARYESYGRDFEEPYLEYDATTGSVTVGAKSSADKTAEAQQQFFNVLIPLLKAAAPVPLPGG